MDAVAIPGGRDVRATLDGSTDAAGLVVACPPHPQFGGTRRDKRLRAVADALPDDVACLRIDYGPWDEGRSERVDARNAVEWGRDRFEGVGLFGYSFGAAVALLAACDLATPPAAVAALAPPGTLDDGADVAAALDGLDVPVQVVYGARDDTVDWEPVVERARERSFDVRELPADHHFVGQTDGVAAPVAEFLSAHL